MGLLLKKIFKRIGIAAFSASMLLGSAAHAGLVSNGGFESQDFSGWQQFGPEDLAMVAADADYVIAGEYAAFFGGYGAFGGITQNIVTNAGQAYALSFLLRNLGGGRENEESVSYFSVSIDGAVQPASLLYSKEASEFTRYDVAFDAVSNLTELKFEFRQDDNFWILDDVAVDAVTGPSEVPEPGSLALGLAALLAYLPVASRRARARGSRV